MPQVRTAAQLGAAIRAERKRQGLTQAKLAEACGVGINFVSDVERGKETAELGKVLQLVGMLGMDPWVEKRSTWRRVSGFIESNRTAG